MRIPFVGELLLISIPAALFGLYMLLRGPSIVSTLTWKYLRKRRIAWVALVAVMMCTALVLVVISVMGGWLENFRQSARGLTGDIIVKGESLVGFPHYEEMIAQINQVEGVQGSAPVLRSFGLINIGNQVRKGVQVIGLTPDIVNVNNFGQSLYRFNKPRGPDGSIQVIKGRGYAKGEKPSEDHRLDVLEPPDGGWPENLNGGVTLTFTRAAGVEGDGVQKVTVTGRVDETEVLVDSHRVSYSDRARKAKAKKEKRITLRRVMFEIPAAETAKLALGPRAYTYEVTAGGKVLEGGSMGVRDGSDMFYNWPTLRERAKTDVQRKARGMIVGASVALGKDEDGNIERLPIMYDVWTRLTVLPISPYGQMDVTQRSERPFWIVDDSRTQVYVFDSDTVYLPFDVLQEMLNMHAQEAVEENPATGTTRPVTEPARTNEIQVRLKPGVDLKAAKALIAGAVKKVREERRVGPVFPLKVETWQEANADFLGAIEKEKVLVTFLFGMISIVAVFLVFCIFYMIVVEKTRDIGIIKSVGATNAGVAGIFLGYGAAIGIVGSGLGLAIAYAIVRNINQLHHALGRWMGVQIWNPKFYQFDMIPDRMNPPEVAVIIGVAILASVLGAIVPAYRAAKMHPVEALRWE